MEPWQQKNEFADDMRGWAAHQKISEKTVDLLIKEGSTPWRHWSWSTAMTCRKPKSKVDSIVFRWTAEATSESSAVASINRLRRRHGICGGNGHSRPSGRDHRVERDARWRDARNTGGRDARNTGGRESTGRRLHALDGGPHAFNGFHSVWSHSDKPRSLEPCHLSRYPFGRYPFGRIPISRCP